MTTIPAFLTAFGSAFPQVPHAEFHHPRCGRRGRAFLSAADAAAYERGWDMHPGVPDAPLGSPLMQGWLDRESYVLDNIPEDDRDD